MQNMGKWCDLLGRAIFICKSRLFPDRLKEKLHFASLKNSFILICTRRGFAQDNSIGEDGNKMKRKIWFIGTPEHSNMGDHLITEAQFSYMNEVFPECDVKEVSLDDYYDVKPILKKTIGKNDILIFNGGGSVGNIWPRGEEMRRDAISSWPENIKIIFPQSIFFTGDENGAEELEKTQKALKENVILGCRDKQSYDFAKEHFFCETFLTPDIALFPDYPKAELAREGALLCIREGREALLSEAERRAVFAAVREKYDKISVYDMVRPENVTMEKRRKSVEKTFNEFASAKVVITDRLHGMIFSYITGTPCFVFENSYFKVRGQFDWIKDCNYIHLVKTAEELEKGLEKFISEKEPAGSYKRFSDKFTPLTKVIRSQLAKPLADEEENAPVCVKKGARSGSPVVSVIIPVYNVEPYLRECLDSIMGQTLKEIEIICIDDGSLDGSLDLLREIASSDERICVYHQKNSGLSVTRNRGIDFARGKYIYYMDSDDVLEKDSLESLVRKMEEDSLELVFFDGKSFIDGTASLDKKEAKLLEKYLALYRRSHDYKGVYDGPTIMRDFLNNDEYRPSACLQMIKKDFLEDNQLRFEKGILHEDNLYTFEALLLANRVGYLHNVFFYRRVRAESIMFSKKTFANVFGYFICYKRMKEKLLLAKESEERSSGEKRLVFSRYYAAQELVNAALDNARRIYGGLPEFEKNGYRYIEGGAEFRALITDHDRERQKTIREKEALANEKGFFRTARIDIKNSGATEVSSNALEFFEMTGDVTAKEQKWGTAFGLTYVVTSQAETADFKIKCIGDGNVSLRFRSVQGEVKNDAEYKWWINYKKILIDGENILDGQRCVWYRTPIEHCLTDKKDGDEISIHIEWESGQAAIDKMLEEIKALQKENASLKAQKKSGKSRRC